MRKFIIFLYMCIVLASLPVYGREKLDIKVDKNKLESGQVQIFTIEFYKAKGKGGKKGGIGVILVDAPPSEAWHYLCQWDLLEEFVPTLDECETLLAIRKIVKDEIGESVVEQLFDFPVVNIKFALNVIFDENNLEQSWRLVKKNDIEKYSAKGINLPPPSFGIKDIEGFQYIESYDDGRKSLLYYATNVTASVPVPGFLQKFIVDVSLKGYLGNMKKRIESKGAYKK